MRNPRVAGNLWRCVVVHGGSVVDDFFWVLYIKVLRKFMWVDFLWNLVRNFRNPGWESAGFVELVAILVYIVVLMLAALTGGWLHLDLTVKREMVSHHFFVSLHWMSSFIFKLRCRLPWPLVHLNLQKLTFFIFLAFVSEVFYIKACYLPSFITEAHA